MCLVEDIVPHLQNDSISVPPAHVQQSEWSYFVNLLHLICKWSANLVHSQRSLEAKMTSLRAMTCAISCLLVEVGHLASFKYWK
jgi:hypothetical protein